MQAQVVLVVGDGGVVDRAGTRLEAAGQRVLRAPWSRSQFSEVEKGPAATAPECDVLLAFPPAQSEGDARWSALLERVRPGGTVVLAGRTAPRTAAALADEVQARGLAFLDAPTDATGGVIPVGGTEAALAAVRSLVECLGVPVPQGAPGTAQQARLCQEIALGSALIGVCEALVYARAAGLDPERIIEVLPGLGERGGLLMAERARRMLRGEAAEGETVAGLVADADSILSEAESIELDLPGLELVRLLYSEVADMGHGQKGAESLLALWHDDEDLGADLVQLDRR